MKKYICKVCSCEHDGSFGTGIYCSKHCRAVDAGRKSVKQHRDKGIPFGFELAWRSGTMPKQFQPKDGGWKCFWCGEIFRTKRKLADHRKNIHPECCGKNGKAWNKGKTAITDDSVRKGTNTRRERILDGTIIVKSHPHTEETKLKISNFMQNATYRRKCKKRQQYVKADSTVVMMDSSYEVSTAHILDSLGIEWIRPEPLLWVSFDGKKHHYFPDFLLVDYDIYLDPKNEYCFMVQREKIDIISRTYPNVIFMRKEDINENFIRKLIER